ncbi:hypothetical protein [Flavobacterium lipolyticum]|uniref:Uncharacterized protein n=1 Tax=Flavobacterium lipolyticum TaxID=2893754 RepID=A0ABS8M6S0_9FLAO|nr:hypothetical protein [Flavobacterium sp. F-126]MCC9020471.1 hypothetical protein [Flavobacterium sp. F-126]
MEYIDNDNITLLRVVLNSILRAPVKRLYMPVYTGRPFISTTGAGNLTLITKTTFQGQNV